MRFASWLLVGVLLAAFAAVVAVVLRQRAAAGKGMPPYSVYPQAAHGPGEAADNLRQLGWQRVAVTRPISNTHHRGLLIVCAPLSEGLLEQEEDLPLRDTARAMLRWVEQGNTN